MDNDAEGIKVMSEGLLSCGVTSFLPTTLTSSKERLTDVARTIGQVYQEVPGAKIQGFTLKDLSLLKNIKAHKIQVILEIQTLIHSTNGKKLQAELLRNCVGTRT